ncbi:MAG: phage distal tail protein [Armatimonadota bacterium]
MATYTLKLGTYTFPSTFHPSSVPGNSRVATEQIPRGDGVRVGAQYAAEKNISVRGMLRADSPTSLRTAMDSLLAAVNGGRQKLYLWDDRFIWATKVGLTTDYDETSFKRYCFVSVEFLCDSPFWEAETESTDTWSSPSGTHNITVGGNAYTKPDIEITFSTAGTVNLELSIGSLNFTLEGSVGAGETIVVDCGDETVELATFDFDYMSMFDLSFVKLVPGVNVLSLTDGGTATISKIVVRWRNRWY